MSRYLNRGLFVTLAVAAWTITGCGSPPPASDKDDPLPSVFKNKEVDPGGAGSGGRRHGTGGQKGTGGGNMDGSGGGDMKAKDKNTDPKTSTEPATEAKDADAATPDTTTPDTKKNDQSGDAEK